MAAQSDHPFEWFSLLSENLGVDKRDITAAVVAELVATQFPQWADLAVVPVALDGWDNTTFRLGAEALWKALITLAREKQGGENADEAARRFGWRGGPRDVVAAILADHYSRS